MMLKNIANSIDMTIIGINCPFNSFEPNIITKPIIMIAIIHQMTVFMEIPPFLY